MLAFTNKARDEMEERITRLLGAVGKEIAVHTFHSLGLKILSDALDVKPSVSPLVQDPEDRSLRRLAEDHLRELLQDPKRGQAVRRFFLRYRYPERDEFDFEKPNERTRHLKARGLQTLRGEYIKSYGELVIANFLTANGVRYEYEAQYKHPTATRRHRQYKPDFHLLDTTGKGSGIYIEYFGIDRNGQTPPGIDRFEYHNAMKWKRGVHQRYVTKLIEVYYYELREGELERVLEERLRKLGVLLRPISVDDLLRIVTDQKNNQLTPIAHLLSDFLSLFKSNNWTLDEVRSRIGKEGCDRARALAFLEVFEGFLNRYTAELESTGEIDFDDMIVKATEAVRSGKYRSPSRYILVDEFQDISRGRANLLRAILEQHHDRRLFCVGDDWQSIFRFTGSDIGIMVRFSDQFGVSEASSRRTDLNETFRLTCESLEVSSRFIQRNPVQLKKTLVARRSFGKKPIRIIYKNPPIKDRDILETVLEEIGGDHVPASVLILGRYNHVLPTSKDLNELREKHSSLQLEALTVHKAKGLQADYVVVLDVVARRYGFPTEISDDSLLELVLSAADAYPNAEERRLLYVGLTRARNRTYLITDPASRSVFIDELESPDNQKLVESDYQRLVENGVILSDIRCPKCGSLLIRRKSEHGVFYGCTLYPYCDGRAKAKFCPRCREGVLVKRRGKYGCSNPHCDTT